MKCFLYLLFYLMAFGFYSQKDSSDFEKKWNNPNYEKLTNIADSAYNKLDFLTASIFYEKAYKIRPSNYPYRSSEISKLVLKRENHLFTSIILTADSLIEKGKDCDGIKLLYSLRKYYQDERIEEALSKVHHPIHCEKIDNIYFLLVTKADELFEKGNLNQAALVYERALLFNMHEEYPKTQIEYIKTQKNK